MSNEAIVVLIGMIVLGLITILLTFASSSLKTEDERNEEDAEQMNYLISWREKRKEKRKLHAKEK